MTADVVKGTQDAGAIAHHQDRRARDVGREEGACLGHRVSPADHLPGVAENRSSLQLVRFDVGVPGCGNGAGTVQRQVRVERG